MIKYIDFFIPAARLSTDIIFSKAHENEKLPLAFNSASEGVSFFKNTIDLDEVSYSSTMTEVDMLSPLLSQLFNVNIVDKSKIELIIIVGDELNKGSRLANLGHYIQHSYHINNADVVVLSGNHCSNVEYAISYGESLLKSGDLNNILILAVNKLIRDEERIIGAYAIQGDGAGIIYMNKDLSGGIDVIGKHSYTNGLLYEANVNSDNSFLLCKNYLVCLSQFVKKFKVIPSQVANVIIQNANYLLVNQCLNSMGFKNDQIFMENINRYGHLDCVDFIVNLKAIMDKKVTPSTKIISFGTGWAGSNISLYMEVK